MSNQTEVTFFALTDSDPQGYGTVCQLCADAFTYKKRVNVWCANQQQAEEIDQLLWSLPTQRFIPHNLHGEGPRGGAPVEVCWQEQQLRRGAVILVLSEQPVTHITHCAAIYDFVPVADEPKQNARNRYKHYQKAGCAMKFDTIAPQPQADS